MTKISVIIPACIQDDRLLQKFSENLKSFGHEAIAIVYVVCNRLSLMSPESLQAFLQRKVSAPVRVINEGERSVAGAWNRGVELAMEDGLEVHMITAVDVSVTDETIDALLEFEVRSRECDLWSSTAESSPAAGTRAACDFSCFMIRNATIRRHGWFDREYKPAYFEDNDYVTRVVLGGGRPTQVLTACHRHEGSLTVKLDAEMAHHVGHWFPGNRARFLAKWGFLSDDYSSIPRFCYSTPYCSGKALSWWPEQDRDGYHPAGMIHG